MTRAPSSPRASRTTLRRAGIGAVALAAAGRLRRRSAPPGTTCRSAPAASWPRPTPRRTRAPGPAWWPPAPATSCGLVRRQHRRPGRPPWGWDDLRVYAMEDAPTAADGAEASPLGPVRQGRDLERHRHQRPGGRRRRARRGQDRRVAAGPDRRRHAHDVRRHAGRRRPGSAASPCRASTATTATAGRAAARRRPGRGARAPTGSASTSNDAPDRRCRTVDLAEPDLRPRVVAEQTYDARARSRRGSTATPSGWWSAPGCPTSTSCSRPERTAASARRAPRTARSSAPARIEDWLPDGPRRRRATPGCWSTATRAAPRRPRPAPAAWSWSASTPPTPATRSVTGVATASQTVYSSTDRLYLATSAGWGAARAASMVDGTGAASTTRHHRRCTRSRSSDADATYVASGEVGGLVADRWSMDEHDGVLRVAVGADRRHRQLQLGGHLRRADGDPRRGRPGRRARRRRADQVGALVRRPRDRGDLPADRPALHRRPVRPGAPAAAGRAEDPGLLASTSTRSATTGCSASARTPTTAGRPAAGRRRCSTSPT